MIVQSDVKRCPKCGEIKCRSKFHRRQRAKDGLQSYCKDCDKITTLAQRATPEGLEYVRQWRQTESGKKSTRAYLESDAGRKTHCINAAKHRAEHSDKAKARSILSNAVIAGSVIRPLNCSVCGIEPLPMRDGRSALQAHHHDYTKPLDVQWLCSPCHKDLHNG